MGYYGRDEASTYSGAGLGPGDVAKLPGSVLEYAAAGYDKDLDTLLLTGLLAGMMRMSETPREPRPIHPSSRVAEGQSRLPFEESTFDRRPPPSPPEPEWPHHFRPSESDVKDGWMATAKQWVDAGWDDKDDFDMAVLWWANWFSPSDALTFTNELAEYDKANLSRGSSGMPIEMAIALRDRGIDAFDVIDGLNHSNTVINIKDMDAVVAAVEKSRDWLRANKRRRSSRR